MINKLIKYLCVYACRTLWIDSGEKVGGMEGLDIANALEEEL